MADYSNPLPPPQRPGEAPRAPPPATPRSNADFRALLATPRVERGGEYSGSAGIGGQRRSGGTAGAEKKVHKPKKPNKPKKEDEGAKEAKEDEGPSYRDRADERRKGVNPDYDGYADVNTVSGSTATAEAGLTIDETKFLGGDVEHTHLVKGLDYALLQKVRTEEDAKESEEAAEAKARAKMLRTKEFKTPVGRNVFRAIFQPPRRDVAGAFLPRRTAFVYDMEDTYVEIPTTLRRSKDDCPKPVESMLGVVDGAVLERLAKIMGYMRTAPGAKPGKRLKKREKRAMLEAQAAAPPPPRPGPSAQNGHAATTNGAVPPAAAANDDEEDIFGGVGRDYELPETRVSAAAGAKKAASYFDKKDDMIDLPAVPTGEAFTAAAAASAEGAPPPPPELPPPPPPPPAGDLTDATAASGQAMDVAPGPAMPPADYNYDYSAAYSTDLTQQWAQTGYAAGYDAYGQPLDPAAYAAAAAAAAAGDPSAAAALQEDRELTTQEKDAGLGSVFKRDDDRLSRMREKDEREKDPSFVSDSYAECYPDFHTFGTTVVDSDEEDLSHMDTKAGKDQSRSNYNTEEEWQAAKAKQETMPKAAFQFGLKMGDGRKTHKNLLKAKDSKFKNELNSIKGILEEKSGSKYRKAFEEASEDGRGSGGGLGGPAKRKRLI